MILQAKQRLAAAESYDFTPKALVKDAHNSAKSFEKSILRLEKSIQKAIKQSKQSADTQYMIFPDRQLNGGSYQVFGNYLNSQPIYVLVDVDFSGMDKAQRKQVQGVFDTALDGVSQVLPSMALLCKVVL